MLEVKMMKQVFGNNLQERWEQVRGLGESICQALANEVRKIGITDKARVIAPWERASFELQRDPANGEYSLLGIWKDVGGGNKGRIIFHSDGSFYAEYDVVEPHPQDQRWFVEAVHAWGKNGNIKTEPRLLPMEY